MTEPSRLPQVEQCGDSDASVLGYDENTFASIFVSDSHDFETIVEEVVSTIESSEAAEGIVLCSSGERASVVQQIADTLCDQDGTAGTDRLTLEKVGSDVVGDHKDELEFRLFLHTVV